MPNYDLDRLGDEEFEHLVQALLKKIIGAGTITFGAGPDGGREATYTGKAPYPSPSEQWEGEWIFQAKFHNVRQVGPDKARKAVLNDLKTELEKTIDKQKRNCQNYILATNVTLTAVSGVGTHDKIAEDILPQYLHKIPHVHVWGYDELSRFLDIYNDVRQTYLHLITPGDLISELMDRGKEKKALTEILQLFVGASFDREQYAQLDQAGEVGEKPMPLRRVFIDLDVKPRSDRDIRLFLEKQPDMMGRFGLQTDRALSATSTLVKSDIPRTVLIGGPGQGKSTLCQFIAQIHRAYLTDRVCELDENSNFTPSPLRIPFRVILKDYAQWIVDSPNVCTLERYLSTLMEERAGRQVSPEQIQEIVKQNPTLLILDGLDEVTDKKLRDRMLSLLSEFIARCEVLKANLQVVATSRPTGYLDQFDPSRFLHLSIVMMDSDKVFEYTERWVKTKELETVKGNSLRSSIKDCLADPQFSALMNTPLQVTIFILIILSGGTPPRQREELFNEYLEVIYKRERSKSKTIIQTEKRLLFGLHQYMGYLLHRRAAESTDTGSRIKEGEFGTEVLRYLRHNDPYSDMVDLQQRADQMLKEARERLVLLVGLEAGYIGFEQRSIQEFFAAAYLVDEARGDIELFGRFQAISLPPHWRNVALFFAGRVGRCHPGEAAHILEACREIDRHKPDQFIKRGAWLALDIAADRSFGPNRILQRSAIEHTLTLLDGDFDRDRRSEFISRLRQLPSEDLQDHVVPLLLDRLQKAHIPETFFASGVFRAISEDSSPVEAFLDSALESRRFNRRTLLRKALEYRLPPAYIKLKFAETCARLAQGAIADLFLPYLFDEGKYVAEIWRAIGLSDSAAISVFNAALTSQHIVVDALHFGVDRRPRAISLPIPPDVQGQIVLAIELLTEIRQRRMRMRMYTTHDTISQSLVQDVMQIALDPSAVIELRASAFALVSHLEYSPGSTSSLENFRILHGKFSTSLKTSEAETADRILFHTGAVSLELGELSEEQGSELQRFLAHRRHFEEWARVSRGLLPFVVLDALDTKRCKEILGKRLLKNILVGNLQPDALKVVVRSGELLFRTPSVIPWQIVTRTLHVASDIIKQGGPEEWRAWATLARLCTWVWPKRLPKRGQLEQTIATLCDTLEKKVDLLPGRWEIAGLLMRVAETGALPDAVKRILNIISRMGDGGSCDRDRAGYVRQVNPQIMQQLLETAIAAGDQTFRGFLKFFAWVIARLVRLRAEEKGLHLELNTKRVRAIIRSTRGSVREGALLLLARDGMLAFDDTRRLLECSRSDDKPVDRAWAELLRATVRDFDTKEVIAFLESVLSPATRCTRTAKYAAMAEYDRISKSTIVDIREHEQELGLPFHLS